MRDPIDEVEKWKERRMQRCEEKERSMKGDGEIKGGQKKEEEIKEEKEHSLTVGYGKPCNIIST